VSTLSVRSKKIGTRDVIEHVTIRFSTCKMHTGGPLDLILWQAPLSRIVFDIFASNIWKNLF